MENEKIEAQRAVLNSDENRRVMLSRVFGGADGRELLEWLLDISGFWLSSHPDERAAGKFELGRFVFNSVCMANLETVFEVLIDRRDKAERRMAEYKRRLEDTGGED